ncbi:hypothetical protein ACQ0QQ_22355 [Lysinibacillus sphaericus]
MQKELFKLLSERCKFFALLCHLQSQVHFGRPVLYWIGHNLKVFKVQLHCLRVETVKLDLENLQVMPYPVEDRSAKVDLALEVTEKGKELV